MTTKINLKKDNGQKGNVVETPKPNPSNPKPIPKPVNDKPKKPPKK